MKKALLALVITLIVSSFAFAANDSASHGVTLDVTEVVLIDLNDTSTITLSTNPPTNGGESVVGATDSSKLLQYTSLVGAGTARSISVAWGAGDSAPAGTNLSLQATSVPANSGTAAGSVTLSSTAQNLITNIGSCATGTGANGAALEYTFAITDHNSLVVGDTQSVTVTFTLTDAS